MHVRQSFDVSYDHGDCLLKVIIMGGGGGWGTATEEIKCVINNVSNLPRYQKLKYYFCLLSNLALE